MFHSSQTSPPLHWLSAGNLIVAHGDYAHYTVKIQTDRLEWARGGICFLLILLVLPADLLIVLVYGIQSDNGLNQSELGV